MRSGIEVAVTGLTGTQLYLSRGTEGSNPSHSAIKLEKSTMENKPTKKKLLTAFISFLTAGIIFMSLGRTGMAFVGIFCFAGFFIFLAAYIKKEKESENNKQHTDDDYKYDLHDNKNSQFTEKTVKHAESPKTKDKVAPPIMPLKKENTEILADLDKIINESGVLDKSDWKDTFESRLNNEIDYKGEDNK